MGPTVLLALLSLFVACAASSGIAELARFGTGEPRRSLAEQTPRDSGDSVFRTRTDLVALNVTVLDDKGSLVGGLTSDAFAVTEDGQPRAIAHFTAQRAPISLVLALDASESMTGERFEVARQAVLRFFETQGPDDEITVIGFNDRVFSIAPWTRLSSTVEAALRQVRPIGSTSLYGAVIDAVDALRASTHRRQAVVVISDGNDFRPSDMNSKDPVPPAQRRMMLALQRLENTEALVYAIGVDAGPPSGTRDKTFDGAALRKLTDPTGGFSVMVHSLSGVPEAAARIAGELQRQYVIGFAPAHAADGRFHHVRVTTSACKCRVRARAGYSADRSPKP